MMGNSKIGIVQKLKYKCRKCRRTHHWGSWIYFEHIVNGGVEQVLEVARGKK